VEQFVRGAIRSWSNLGSSSFVDSSFWNGFLLSPQSNVRDRGVHDQERWLVADSSFFYSRLIFPM
jgi:hypothetical protein